GPAMRMGDHVRLREPYRFTARDFNSPDWGGIESIVDRFHHVFIDKRWGVDIELPPDLHRLSLNQFTERYIEPAMHNMAMGVFQQSAGAELLVTVPTELPPPTHMIPATIMASGEGLNLRCVVIDRELDGYAMVWREPRLRIDMTWGALRPEDSNR